MNWQTLLVPAAVALVTTLLVEFFAKPRLEARKERIAGKYQRRRIARTAASQMLMAVTKMGTYQPLHSAHTRALFDKAAAEFEVAFNDFWTACLDRSLPTQCDYYAMSTFCMGYVELSREHPLTSPEMSELLLETVGDLVQVLIQSRVWRRRRRGYADNIDHQIEYFREHGHIDRTRGIGTHDFLGRKPNPTAETS